jgi:hypothetical protein
VRRAALRLCLESRSHLLKRGYALNAPIRAGVDPAHIRVAPSGTFPITRRERPITILFNIRAARAILALAVLAVAGGCGCPCSPRRGCHD